jgi:ATP-dependent Clp protease protease subunit
MAAKKEKKPVAPITSGVYLLFGEIDSEKILEVCGWIITENSSENPPDVLNLVINSPGGSLTDAFALISIMQGSQIPIRTVGIGEVASAGLLILMSGTPGLRTIDSTAEIMSHNFSAGSTGTYLELQNISKQYAKVEARIVAQYKKCTKLSEAEIREKLIPTLDVYLTAKEAIKLGLADAVGGL